MNLCVDCGEQNDSDARFCKKCGTLLIEKNETPDEAVVKKSADCMICGTDSSDGAEFCESCGHSIKMVLCDNCTEIVDPGSKCCTSCGAPLISQKAKSNNDESSRLSLTGQATTKYNDEEDDELAFYDANRDSIVAQFTKTKRVDVIANIVVYEKEFIAAPVARQPQHVRSQQEKSSNKCPKCGSRDIKFQIVTESKHMGCLGWLFWAPISCVTAGLGWLIPIFRTTSKSKSMAICRSCGCSFKVSG